MKNFFIFICCLFLPLKAFSYEIYDADWCRKNGGVIEFDINQNINFNCITLDFKTTPYIKEVYNILCIPYYSSIMNNKEPLFLKLVYGFENKESSIFDTYNWKITENELLRYI